MGNPFAGDDLRFYTKAVQHDVEPAAKQYSGNSAKDTIIVVPTWDSEVMMLP